MKASNLLGTWKSCYIYPYNGDQASKHDVVLEQIGNNLLVGKSIADQTGSELILSLEYDQENNLLTGTWQEKTSPIGEWKGAIYHGSLQMVLNSDQTQAHGKWAGFNGRKTEVLTGEWSLTR